MRPSQIPVSVCALIVLPLLAWGAEADDGASPEARLAALVKSQSLSSSADELESLLLRVSAKDAAHALAAVRNNPSPELRRAVMACARRPEPAAIQAALRVLPLVGPE